MLGLPGHRVSLSRSVRCGAGVQASLTGLYQAIEARLALYKPLLSLQGRLDLVLAQAAPADPLASQLAQGPLVSLPA